MALKFKDGFWYWDVGYLVTSPAALFADDVGSLLSLTSSPPKADVVCPRSITFTEAGSPSVTINVVEDAGNLDFTVTVDPAAKNGDLSGLFFDFTNSKLSTLSVSGDPDITQFVKQAGGVMNLTNGVNLDGLGVPNFDVGMEFGLAGIGSNHLNIQSASFVLSDAAHDLSINDLHPANETGNVGVRSLSVGQKLVAVAPYAPTATPDTVGILEDQAITISVGALATDLNNGAILTIDKIGSGFQGPQYGTVSISADGKSLTYTPTVLDYEVDGILTGNEDAFQVCVHDNFGGEVTSFVTVNETPVADAPTIADPIAPPQSGDPATLVRFNVTLTSADFATINQGSDYIKSLALSLTGTNTSGIGITDSDGLLSGNLITPPANNQGSFTDQIIVSLPAGSKFSDTLSMTGTNSETENTGQPATADTTISQTITADTETTLEDVPLNIPIGNLGLGAGMAITAVAPASLGPQFGTVSIAGDGQSLTYTPTTLDDFVNGVATNDQDVFQVYSSDGTGHTAVTLLTVKETPVADAPTVSVSVLPWQNGDPINEVRLEITGTSADFGGVNNGSDFIQSIGLSGTAVNDTSQILVNGQLLTGDTIDASSNTGLVSDEVDLFMNTPVNGTLNDTLAVTATAAETEGSTPAISAPQTQSIVIENQQTNQNLTFQTFNQSMWTTGTAPFTTDYKTGLIGLDKSFKTSTKINPLGLGTVASGSASAHLRAGVQAELKITSGDFSATLPFQIGLDSTYNKTNDTLQIDWSDAQLGGGKFTAHSPNFDLTFGLDFGAKATAHATVLGISVVPKALRSLSVGSFTRPVTGFSLHAGQASHSFPLPGGLSLTLALPTVNTTGLNPNPGPIDGKGISNQDFIALKGDLIAMASDLIFGGVDVTDLGVPGVLSLDVLDLAGSIGLDLVQNFDLNAAGLKPQLTVGDGAGAQQFALTPGVPLTIQHASSLANSSGNIDESVSLVPQATVTNKTSVGADVTGSITALSFSVVSAFHITAFKQSGNLQLGTFPPVYNNKFNLQGFNTATVHQTV